MVGNLLFAIMISVIFICIDSSTALSSPSSQQGQGGDRRPTTPPLPNKSHTPLDIVNFQLSALKNDDMYAVFKYASPANKSVTGPWQRFGNMVRQEPYGILVGHDRAEVLLEWMEPPPPRRYPYLPLKKKLGSSYKCLVRVWSSSKKIPTAANNNVEINSGNDESGRSTSSNDDSADGRNSAVVCKEFCWILSEQSQAGDTLFAGCWMVDGVYPQ